MVRGYGYVTHPDLVEYKPKPGRIVSVSACTPYIPPPVPVGDVDPSKQIHRPFNGRLILA
jgi:hypothetical protein